jgi:hypothetical protein
MMANKLSSSVVVLISGSGSNLQSIIDNADNIGIKIQSVISNKADAFGLERAKKAGIATQLASASNINTMPTPQLKTRYISVISMLPLSCKNWKISGNCHEVLSNFAAKLLGNTLGIFSNSPPPVICEIA